MAVLSAAVRLKLRNAIMRFWSEQRSAVGGILKADLQAAIDAADDWAEANAASYNAALPQPFRGAATAAQKAELLMVVISKRAGIALPQED